MDKNTGQHARSIQTVKETVKEMQEHFSQTGTYRSEDVRHVFGDPRETVRVQTSDAFAFSTRKRT